MPFSAPIFIFQSVSSAAVPVVSAVSYNVVDIEGGGERIVVTVDDSTGCTSISAGGVNFTLFAIDDATHVSGVPGPHAAGVVDVVVTNGTGPSTTGTGLIEYWYPGTNADVTLFYDKSDYVNGTWTPRVALPQVTPGITAELLSIDNADAPVTGPYETLDGGPLYPTSGVSRWGLRSATAVTWSEFLGPDAGGDTLPGFIASVFKCRVPTAYDVGLPYNHGAVVGSLNAATATIGLAPVNDGGTPKIAAHIYGAGYTPITVTVPGHNTKMNAVSRWGTGTDTFTLSVNGDTAGALYTDGGNLLSVGFHGGYVDSGYAYVSAGSLAARTYDGTVDAICIGKSRISNAFITNFDAWSRQRYGVGVAPRTIEETLPNLYFIDGNYNDAGLGVWLDNSGNDYNVVGGGEVNPAASSLAAPIIVSTDWGLTSATTSAGEFIGNGDYEILAVIDLTGITASGAVASYLQDPIITDDRGYVGLFLNKTGAGPYQYWARIYQYDVAEVYEEVEITSVLDGSGAGWFTIQGKYEGGSIYIRLNGGSWSAGSAVGALGSNIYPLWIGGASAGVGMSGTVHCIATWTRALGAAESNMVADIGNATKPTVISTNYSIIDTTGSGQRVIVEVDTSVGCKGIMISDTYVRFHHFKIEDATHVSGIAPAHAAGAVSISVMNAGGWSAAAPGLIEYWDPTAITGVTRYFDSSKNVTDAGGGEVSSWIDVVGADTATQATAINRPILTPNVFGTMPSIKFTPEQWLGLSGGEAAISPFSYFIVMKTISSADYTTATTPAFNPGLTFLGGSGWNGFGVDGGMVAYKSYDVALETWGSGVNDGDPHIIGMTSDVTPTRQGYIDGVAAGTPTALAGTPVSYYDHLGNGLGNVDGFDGDIGAFISLGGTVISAPDLAKLNAWSKQRFGTP